MKLWKVRVRKWPWLRLRYTTSEDVDVLIEAETADQAMAEGREYAHATAFFGARNDQVEAMQAAPVRLPCAL